MTKLKLFVLTLLLLGTNYSFGQDSIQQKINYYISQAKLDSAKAYIETKLTELDKKEQKDALNYQLVKVLFMQSAYDESLLTAFNSLDNIKEEKERVKFNFMIGVIYSSVMDYEKSIDYYNLVVSNSKDSSLLVKSHVLLSDLYLGLKDSTKAVASINQAYKITTGANLEPGITNHVAMQYNFYNENYEECKRQNIKVIQDSTSFLNTKSYAYSMIGDCLTQQDSLLEAIKYFDEFLNLTIQTKDPEQIKVAAKKLIKTYEKLGDQDKANAYHKIYNEAVNDSLSFSPEKYRALYNVERVRELKIEKNKSLWRNIAYGFIVLILFVFGIYYYRKSVKKKRGSGKKIVISDAEIKKLNNAIDKFTTEKAYLKSNITRNSFCLENNIKSERYLSQYINDQYKKSFSNFLNDLRVEHSYERIKTDVVFRNYRVEEIAKACGFGSKKSFERAFISKYNETPYKLITKLNS